MQTRQHGVVRNGVNLGPEFVFDSEEVRSASYAFCRPEICAAPAAMDGPAEETLVTSAEPRSVALPHLPDDGLDDDEVRGS